MFSIINTGLTSSQRDLSVTANNLANSNTVGFKKSKSNFVDVFANDPTSNPKTAVGSGTMMATVDKDMSQGAMSSTGRVTDLAIAGKGFFTLGATGTLPVFSAVPTSTFSGAGLTQATWPAIPSNPPYPSLQPISGTGLPNAIWTDLSPTTFVGFNLPSTNAPTAKQYTIDIGYSEPTFTNGDFSAVGETVNGNVVSVPGWKIVKEQVILGKNGADGSTIIAGRATPNDPTAFPVGKDDLVSRGDEATPTEATFIGSFTNGVATLGSINVTTEVGGDVVHGSYLESADYVHIKAGASVSFKWKVEAGGDEPDAFGYLVRSDGKIVSLLDHTGSISNFESITQPVDEEGNYKFVFVAGTFDYSFGNKAGSKLFIDDVKITNNTDTTNDAYKVFVDGVEVASGTRADAPTQIDLSSAVKTWGSVVEVEFANQTDVWPWSYDLKENGTSVKSNAWTGSTNSVERDAYNTEPTGPGNVAGGVTNWSEGTLSGTCKNVFLCNAGSGDGSLGGFLGRDPYISFGNGGDAGQRFLSFDSLDLRDKDTLSFDVINGSNFNGGEDSDGGEGIDIEYSIDGGTTYKKLTSLPVGTLFPDWTAQAVTLPEEARISSALLRFHQPNSSGPQFDQWGFSSIRFSTTEPATDTVSNGQPTNWAEGNQRGTANNVFVTPADGTGIGSNGAFFGEAPAITFGSGGSAGPRAFTIDNLDFSHTNAINFKVRHGNDTNGGEQPDAPLENLNVLFSIDGGTTFNTLTSFSADDLASGFWQSQSLSLPNGAKMQGVIVKFEQPGSSGSNFDHWAISNITFSTDPTPPFAEPATSNQVVGTPYNWTLDGLTGTAQNVFTSNEGAGTGRNSPFTGQSPYISFGGDGAAGQRILTYPPLDLRGKASIRFDLIAGNDSNGGDHSNTNEGLSLEYSNDGGKTFKLLKSFNDGAAIADWASQTIPLPTDASTENVQIRFRQEGSSGAQYDHWGLANIQFIDSPKGPAIADKRVYTRAGNFQLDKDGYLTASNGLRVLGTNIATKNELEAVRIAASYNGNPLAGIDINSAGRITATYGDGSVRPLYDLAIASFDNDSGLKQIGNTQFAATGDSGTARYLKPGSGVGTVMAATLEQSNTDITGELMNMLKTQQNYNANARMLQAYVEVASRLTDKI